MRAASALVLKLSKHGFAKLLDSVKNELRVDGARLNARDRHLFFALAEFLLCWRRERAGLLAKRLQQHQISSRRCLQRPVASRTAGVGASHKRRKMWLVADYEYAEPLTRHLLVT